MMKKSVLYEVDTPLVVESCSIPTPRPDEVIVNLKAAALNHRDVWIQKGLYAGIVCPLTLGSDGAGTVSASGEDVDVAWRDRDVILNPSAFWGSNPATHGSNFEILGLPRPGTHATHIAISADRLVAKPEALSWVEAAALPLAALTAYRALFARGRLTSRDTVLVTGIGGGVALFALQFASAAGARVVVTSSSKEKRQVAMDMGASAAFDYTQADWPKDARKLTGGIDLAVDGAGGDGLGGLIDLCNPGGRIVLYGATAGLPTTLELRKVFWKQLNILGTTMGNDDDFLNMITFMGANQIRPVVDTAFSLEEINEAYRRMERGAQFGKIVLDMT